MPRVTEPARSRDPNGTWLTYRYRFGGPSVPETSGTIKAPTFLDAARRLIDGALARDVGDGIAYLRLRAAGEDEVLIRVGAIDPRDGRRQWERVSADAFRFTERVE